MTRKTPLAISLPLSLLLCAAIALPSAAQTIPKRKAGLWESELSGTGPEAAQMKQKMAQMTPEQRAQMQEMMKRNGMGFTSQGAMLLRYCITPEEAEMNGKTLLGKMDRQMENSNCEEKEFKRTGNEIRFHTVCRRGEGTSEFTGHVHDITPTSMAMEMDMKSPRGEQHMTQKAHWVSDDCGALKR